MTPEDLVGHWPKSCPHCRLAWEEPSWKELPLLGRSELGRGTVVELRQCRCGKPLAVATPASE